MNCDTEQKKWKYRCDSNNSDLKIKYDVWWDTETYGNIHGDLWKDLDFYFDNRLVGISIYNDTNRNGNFDDEW